MKYEARGRRRGVVVMRIGAVVLAAGQSRRMGAANKLLLPIDGVAMVRRTVSRVLEAGASPVVVVTGHDAEQVRAALVGVPCAFATSPDPTGPTSTSLHAGLRALPDDVDATIVMLADMVHVTTAMLRDVVVRMTRGDVPLVVSTYGDVQAPPLCFARALWRELLAWTGEGCGKAVVRAHLHEAARLAWPEAALADVDTPADYAAVTGAAGAG
ncbi:MAG: nucleotidyltransferase family protein [Gemmatimonadaceae bacterium]|nr:nucleotidyltransferase family protein [Gemmatimonadaceae bacterium]